MKGVNLIALVSPAIDFLALLALAVASAITLRHSRDIPWVIPAYLILQTLIQLLGWLGLQKMTPETAEWMWFYVAVVIFGSLSELGMGASFAWHLPFGWAVAIAGFCFSLSISASFYSILTKIYGKVPGETDVALIQGLIQSAAGLLMLLSVVLEWHPAAQMAIRSVGFFLLATGVNSFGFAMGIVKHRELCIALNTYAPGVLTIMFMAWLVFQLSGLQGETAREAVLAGVH